MFIAVALVLIVLLALALHRAERRDAAVPGQRAEEAETDRDGRTW